MSAWAQLRTTSGRLAILALLAVMLLGAMLLSLRFGSVEIAQDKILKALLGADDGMTAQIVRLIRLPRILLGAMVGAALAVSGVILQGVMRNPLAAPGLIGISSGGGLAGILVLLALPQFAHVLVPAAFTGSLVTAMLVYGLAWKRGASPVRLVLAGVAVAAMLGALSSAILLFNAEKAGGVLDFTIGSLSARGWEQIRLVRFYLAGGLAAALLLSNKLNILALGDEVAAGLGLKVEQIRFLLIATAALLAAAAVSVAGLLGFVGLIAPHIVRILIGGDNRFLVPGAALFGALMVVGCDTLGRLVMQPAELPVGIIMALLGPPFFLWLLRRNRYEA